MIQLNNLTVSYRHHPALHHISGRFDKGSLTAVVGPNGAGKSTLLKSLVGVLPWASGAVSMAVSRERIAYLPQASEIDRSFPINVFDCVLLGTWSTAGPWRGMSRKLQGRIESALQQVGLEGFEARPVGTLSTGTYKIQYSTWAAVSFSTMEAMVIVSSRLRPISFRRF